MSDYLPRLLLGLVLVVAISSALLYRDQINIDHLSHYILASFVFMLSGSFVFNYLGFAGREALADGEKTTQIIFIVVSLIAALLFVPRIVKSIRTTTEEH